MSWIKQAQAEYAPGWEEIVNVFGFRSYMENAEEYSKKFNNQEDGKMKVSYKECVGELLRLERKPFKEMSVTNIKPCVERLTEPVIHVKNRYEYDLDIWDGEKKCKISFTGVDLKDVKFLGGEVAFGQ